jgi:hypothetical protein
MNKLIRILTVLNLTICAARADQFQRQLKEPAATAGFNVSYARVNITGEHGFSGVTDKLGRIAITGLPNGTYTAKVTDTRKQDKSATFIIDGRPHMKPVSLQ